MINYLSCKPPRKTCRLIDLVSEGKEAYLYTIAGIALVSACG